MAEKPQPVRVLYCGICGLPAEYCEFGPEFEKCKPWSIQNVPDLYPDILKDATAKDADKVSDQLQSTSENKTSPSVGSSTPKQEEVKRLPSGKIKKKEKQEVIIEKVTRNRRKSITTVKGLELFGVKLSYASKKLGKKFATGASVVKGPTEKEQIDVQGDISFDVVDFIIDTWPDVLETAIYFIEDGKKVAAARSFGIWMCGILPPDCPSPFPNGVKMLSLQLTSQVKSNVLAHYSLFSPCLTFVTKFFI